MSAEECCSFCQRLPSLPGRRARRGVAVRCPLCKGWLLRTSLQTYRDEGGPSAEERRPRHGLLLAAALGGLVTLAAVGGFLVTVALHNTPPPTLLEGQPSARVAVTSWTPTPVGEEARPPEPAPAPGRTQPPAPAPERTAAVQPRTAAERPVPSPRRAAEETVTALSPKPAVSPPATAVSVPPGEPDQGQAAPGAPARYAPPPWQDAYTTEELAEMLRRVPEHSLAGPPAAGGGRIEDGARGKAARQDLERTVREQREKFLDGLLAKRPDLAGLPLRKGKDCQLEPAAARALDASSLEVRRRLASSLGPADRRRHPDPESPGGAAAATFAVYRELVRDPRWRTPAGSPALEQILTGEPASVRLALVQYFRSPPDSAVAAAVLARRAVFDPSAEVRQEAVAGLHSWPAADYLPVLLSGLRYPWPPANYHAAEALAALGAEAAVPDLVRVLDAPDPCAPFEAEEGGQRVLAVRELVRLNHHSSCLLCHAPSFAQDDLVRAPVPSPLEPLPPPTRYYGGRRTTAGGLFVRADITYLRQDFSEVQPVENPGPWPNRQRFDFLVRVRRLAEGEVQAWRGRERPTGPLSLPASRQAAAFALRQLTGLDGGCTADSWNEALARAGRPAGPK
jgi:hypothetical protein